MEEFTKLIGDPVVAVVFGCIVSVALMAVIFIGMSLFKKDDYKFEFTDLLWIYYGSLIGIPVIGVAIYGIYSAFMML